MAKERSDTRRGQESNISVKEVARSLRGIDFPASRDDLVRQARDANIGDEVIRQLERMPDQEYQNMADVMKGFGQSDEPED